MTSKGDKGENLQSLKNSLEFITSITRDVERNERKAKRPTYKLFHHEMTEIFNILSHNFPCHCTQHRMFLGLGMRSIQPPRDFRVPKERTRVHISFLHSTHVHRESRNPAVSKGLSLDISCLSEPIIEHQGNAPPAKDR
jgi:hypothetical protein